MTAAILIILWAAQAKQGANNPYYRTLASFSANIQSIFIEVAEGPMELWGKLATPQATNILHDLASDSESLYKRNSDLQFDLEKQVQQGTERTFNIDSRIKELQKSATAMETKLEKFRHEVDLAVGGDSNKHPRANTESAFHAKGEILDDVNLLWKQERYNEAEQSLNEAMTVLERAEKGISCMQKSIESKKKECDDMLFPIKKQEPIHKSKAPLAGATAEPARCGSLTRGIVKGNIRSRIAAASPQIQAFFCPTAHLCVTQPRS